MGGGHGKSMSGCIFLLQKVGFEESWEPTPSGGFLRFQVHPPLINLTLNLKMIADSSWWKWLKIQQGILFDRNVQQMFVKFRVGISKMFFFLQEIPSAPNIEKNIKGLYQNQPTNQPTNTGGLIYNQHVIYTFDLFKGDIKWWWWWWRRRRRWWWWWWWWWWKGCISFHLLSIYSYLFFCMSKFRSVSLHPFKICIPSQDLAFWCFLSQPS